MRVKKYISSFFLAILVCFSSHASGEQDGVITLRGSNAHNVDDQMSSFKIQNENFIIKHNFTEHSISPHDHGVEFEPRELLTDITCPPNGNSVQINAGTYTIKMAESGSLCTLTKHEGEKILGIARSYDEYPWENAAGDVASSLLRKKINCALDSCVLVLPSIDAGATYQLASSNYSISTRDELARFLESATFGITNSGIHDLENISSGSSGEKMSKWIESQMNIPYTSHREFWREGLNPRLPHPRTYGIQDHPCAAGSRWRKYSFVKNDLTEKLPGLLQIKGDGPYILRLNDQPRTVVQNLKIDNDDYSDYIFDPNFEYTICKVEPEIAGVLAIRLEDGSCQNIHNPLVDFKHHEYLPAYIINLPGGSRLQPIDEQWTKGEELILTRTLKDGSCDNVPKLLKFGDPPIFGKLSDGTWLQFDPRLSLQTNSVTYPRNDGGYNEVEMGSSPLCMNTPKNFLNENECYISTVNTCRANDPSSNATRGALVCGSPGEVGNKKDKGFLFDIFDDDYQTQTYDTGYNREYVWIMVVLSASDQLRQRVAWALAQMLVVVPQDIRHEDGRSEILLNYYDIFVRNSFGNYRDILKEISYNPVMGESLTYLDSQSYAYVWRRSRIKAHADENFAREIMQLFTIGTVKLEQDGTFKLDSEGNPIKSYSNDDIMSLSRAWTGFTSPILRGNIENAPTKDGNPTNKIDPMIIQPRMRDGFPKTDLYGGYIGDALPLCVDLPPKAFLKNGATYRLLGNSNLPELIHDPIEFSTDNTIKKFILENSSNLKSKLCNQGEDGKCRYHNTVAIESPIDCIGDECTVDTVRVVQVAKDVYYEYVSQPCVQQLFYNNAKAVSARNPSKGVLCANTLLPVAGEACCVKGATRKKATRNAIYDGERMPFASAVSRCESPTKEACNFSGVQADDKIHTLANFFWTIDDCSIKVKVDLNGLGAIVHHPRSYTTKVLHVDDSSENWFTIFWDNEDFPTPSTECNGVCEVYGNTCLCNTVVNSQQVFSSMPNSIHSIMSKLYIGSLKPNTSESDPYVVHSDPKTGIKAYLKNGNIDIHTVFEFTDNKGQTRLLKNVRETVVVIDGRGESTDYTFRNIPQFMSLIPTEETVRDAQFETASVLDHYFHHDNTAPFIALRLIQRLVSSNPTPRFIEAVATAFRTGRYLSFGTGQYGDLSSTIAAIFLDREARNILLDKDTSSGILREPILKVTSLMRSMDFVSNQRVTQLHELQKTIGQMAHSFQTVFSFFLPEFKPYGKIGDASLVSPEATILHTPNIIGLMNGALSFAKNGLSSCDRGFASKRQFECTDASLGLLEFNRTLPPPDFSFETFEGPSLVGGFDNFWSVNERSGRSGKAVPDPVSSGNYVLNFAKLTKGASMISAPFSKDDGTQSYVTKFRYYSPVETYGGGCIGYLNGEVPVWSFCDYRKGSNLMPRPNGKWITCQFEIPRSIKTFQLVMKDSSDGKHDKAIGDAYFDDIQIVPGSGTTCNGVQLHDVEPPGKVGYSDSVINELSTLLTAGRLDNVSRRIIRKAYDTSGSADDGLRTAQKLMLTTSEFHSTNIAQQTSEEREQFDFPDQNNKPYKAVIMMMFAGGCDSFNLLVPYSCTTGKDLKKQYYEARQSVALDREKLHPIDASDQVCEQFGIHNALPIMKELYDDEDLLFLANTGILSTPVDKNNWNKRTKSQLFGHNTMQAETQMIDPLNKGRATGVLGRMGDILTKKDYNVGSFAIDGNAVALNGVPGVQPQSIIVGGKGITPFMEDSDTIRSTINKLHNKTVTDSGIFGDTWSSNFITSLGVTEKLLDVIPDSTRYNFPDTKLGSRLQVASRIIASRKKRGVNRDIIFVELGGFDTHSDVEERLNLQFEEVNGALKVFREELKDMDVWDEVTTVEVSDFGRTMTPNGKNGTDHGWGGNYVMFGGAVKGGQMLGKYPDDLTEEGPLRINRGRMIPSTPWDACFRGIAEWFGVDMSEMDEACPNCDSFPESLLFRADDMFKFSTGSPTETATVQPTKVTDMPSALPSSSPQISITEAPTFAPTISPTSSPSEKPSEAPSTNENVCNGRNRKNCKKVKHVCNWGKNKIRGPCNARNSKYAYNCAQHNTESACINGNHAGLCDYNNGVCHHLCDGLDKKACGKLRNVHDNNKMCTSQKIKNPCKGCNSMTICPKAAHHKREGSTETK